MKKGEEGGENPLSLNSRPQLEHSCPRRQRLVGGLLRTLFPLSLCHDVNSSPSSSYNVLSWLLVSKLLFTHISYLIYNEAQHCGRKIATRRKRTRKAELVTVGLHPAGSRLCVLRPSELFTAHHCVLQVYFSVIFFCCCYSYYFVFHNTCFFFFLVNLNDLTLKVLGKTHGIIITF